MIYCWIGVESDMSKPRKAERKKRRRQEMIDVVLIQGLDTDWKLRNCRLR